MWTSLCNFFCNKLFRRQKISFQQRSDSSECIYGKRLKLVDHFWNTNAVAGQNSSSSSMQSENVEISDDEEECCIIAEIPRRKKAWSCVMPEKKPEAASLCVGGVESSGSLSTFALRKSPLDNINNAEEVQFLGIHTESYGSNRGQTKKFFMSPRICRNQGRVVKSRLSYKNYLRRKMNYLQESYRLTEKFQYMQLLQSLTSFNLLTVKPTFKSIKGPPKPVEVIDLTDDKTDDIHECYNISPEIKFEQDVQIMKEISKVRSFQDLLKIKSVNTETTLNKLVSSESKSNQDVIELNMLSDKMNNLVSKKYSSLEASAESLEEKLNNFMLITSPRVEEVDDINRKCDLPKLSCDQLDRIRAALRPEPGDEILSEGFGLQITRRDMQALLGLNWLNDEIINFYCSLIAARSETNSKLPKVYAFNTFFYPNLVTGGYPRIRRWTKRVDIFSYDLILVPVHLGMHWCLSVIEFRNKSIRYYDSIGSPNDSCLERLLFYLKAESLDKKKKIFSTYGWEKRNVDDIPQQMNGADCGVFSCMFAEYITRDCNISFTQEDMPYFRKKIIIEILDKKLLT